LGRERISGRKREEGGIDDSGEREKEERNGNLRRDKRKNYLVKEGEGAKGMKHTSTYTYCVYRYL